MRTLSIWGWERGGQGGVIDALQQSTTKGDPPPSRTPSTLKWAAHLYLARMQRAPARDDQWVGGRLDCLGFCREGSYSQKLGKIHFEKSCSTMGEGGEERESNKIDGKNDYKGIQLVVTWHENTFPRVNGKPR